MNKLTQTFFILFISLLIFPGRSAYSKSNKPETCITPECHAGMNKDIFIHGPVSAGQCGICHGESPGHDRNPKKNKFAEIEDVAGKCYSCHEKFKEKKFTHVPVEAGACTACHSPHSSPNRFQLLAKDSSLCFTCHDESLIAGNFVHGPAGAGGCVLCHDPHTADYEKNLRKKPPELCFMCHTDKAENFKQGRFAHKPAAESCVNCHNPHSDSKKYMLALDVPDLCFGCHKDKKEWVESVSVKHGALKKERLCLNCHDPHVSDFGKMLLRPTMELCLKCHDQPIEAKDGKVLINMKKWLLENNDHHGPIRQKDCAGCHNPHGSNNIRILKEYYPPTFYISFSPENYGLCFSCHDKAMVNDPETLKLTNFRNAEVNLHFKHVNRSEKGRTCRACHETHASNHPKHIRESVPFGTWELPVNYQKTETGGSCAPGCHKKRRYDRIKKEINQ